MLDELMTSTATTTDSAEGNSTADEQAKGHVPHNAVLQKILPRLREIALQAALAGPVIVGSLSPDSHGHGGGWAT